jgi:hypothetical protein
MFKVCGDVRTAGLTVVTEDPGLGAETELQKEKLTKFCI